MKGGSGGLDSTKGVDEDGVVVVVVEDGTLCGDDDALDSGEEEELKEAFG